MPNLFKRLPRRPLRRVLGCWLPFGAGRARGECSTSAACRTGSPVLVVVSSELEGAPNTSGVEHEVPLLGPKKFERAPADCHPAIERRGSSSSTNRSNCSV